MTASGPTFTQIKAQVAAVRQKVPEAQAVGIRALGRWSGDKERRDGDQTYWIYQCDSPLAMRIALRERAEGPTTKVLVTDLEENEISQDILLRLAKRRLIEIDPWQIVKSLFQAHTVDPRISRQPWIAEALLESAATEAPLPAKGGFLDAEVVWSLLLSRHIGLVAENVDLTALLKWSTDPDLTERFRQLPEDFRQGAVAWLAQRAGPACEEILGVVERSGRPEAVPLGLAAGVIFHPAVAGRLQKAAGKLEERFLGGREPRPEVIARWASAATEAVRLNSADPRTRPLLARGDEILRELQAEEFAFLSATSPLGFEQRLARCGVRIEEIVRIGQWDQVAGLRDQIEEIRQHDRAAREPRRLERLQMSWRLLRWLAARRIAQVPKPGSFAEACADNLREGGFVEWARLTLRAGDPVRELSSAYTRVFQAVSEIREAEAHGFAKLLASWTAAGSSSPELLTVEQVIQEVVTPLASSKPVLLLVLDGMSVAVCHELLADIARHDWVPLVEQGRHQNRPAIATLPSVTEFSRTSLLSGRLRRGTGVDELAGFSGNATLLAKCRSGHPPILFLKPSLQEAGGDVLAAEVREAIASPNRQVVGVVVNAVDDNLVKGEQIDVRWTRDEIKVLPALLHEARSAGRIVVLTSDHGHVLDCQTEARLHDDGERWRQDDGKPAADELEVHGDRVFTETRRLIAPWSERVRYGVKKNGYHGGLNPQEMVVPIVVLGSGESAPLGWCETALEVPGWWEEPVPAGQTTQPATLKPKPVEQGRTGTLFDMGNEEPPSAVIPFSGSAPEWISRLLASEVFGEQRRLAGRAVPEDAVFARLLAALEARGGKMTSPALARAIDRPLVRLPGLLAVMQRVLNVDGYPVLGRDEPSDTIELNRDLLLRQFDLA